MSHKVSWDDDAQFEDVVEAVRRVFVRDGVPRHVYEDGKIMKYDWATLKEYKEEELEGMTLDEHVKRLLDGQQG